MREKYPPIEPFHSDFFAAGSKHKVYFEESGNPKGVPVLFLHGGPGIGTDPGHRGYFDPKIYRIILMDQRGSGKSTPYAELEENTTWDLVQDIETLRALLQIEKWVVFGGSWGSTLALIYAETYPGAVLALILRGIFLGRKKDIDWFYQFGAHRIFREEWEKYIEFIPENERDDLLGAYYKRLTSSNPSVRKRAASIFSSWEGANLRLHFDPKAFESFTDNFHADALARIECHYFINFCFLKTDHWILENIQKIKKIPAIIIHGRYDLVCPFEGAWELHQAWPEAELQIIPGAGHAASEPGVLSALLDATDRFGSIFFK